MPIIRKTVSKSRAYYQFGEDGKRYYYKPNDPKSRGRARSKALRQSKAIFAKKQISL